MSISSDAVVSTQRSFWNDSTCIPMIVQDTTRYQILLTAAARPIFAKSSCRLYLLHTAIPKVFLRWHRLDCITVISCLQLKRNWLSCQLKKDRNSALWWKPYSGTWLLRAIICAVVVDKKNRGTSFGWSFFVVTYAVSRGAYLCFLKLCIDGRYRPIVVLE